ncbi:MAG: type II toxin-antitoxin system prevent-host-death family antitoxin [Rhodospirillaceae bacterium]|nr:type II toxin-antitoxin system prevent-host-death family antitoxin [Rhodospirillaceae bacterium]
MTTVGLRALKNQLSAYVRRAAAGETILVTDRGKVVAELVPPAPAAGGVHAALAEMARRGEMRLATRAKVSYPVMPKIVPDGTALRLLDDDRGSR